MEAYRARAQVNEDGTLTLSDLPFQAGAEVEVIVLAEVRKAREGLRYPLRGTPIRYTDPFKPVAEEDWEALR